jgi:hypothetical protein
MDKTNLSYMYVWYLFVMPSSSAIHKRCLGWGGGVKQQNIVPVSYFMILNISDKNVV